MPRGRHRHSPPLHRLLPPSVIAGVSVACGAACWFVDRTLPLRGLASVAAFAAVVGAVVMRGWDLTAGKRVADLTRGRASDAWQHEERVAELEGDLEESREVRAKLEQKLRAKRAELAGLRGEHAALLRRYANAETERASALEGRRQLAIEAAAPTPALTSSSSPPALRPSLYLRANRALDRLAPPRPATHRVPPHGIPLPERGTGREAGEQGKDAAAGHRRAAAGTTGHRAQPGIAAAPRRPALTGGFDYFGTKSDPSAALESVQHADLADVVGEEALAEHQAEEDSGAPDGRSAEEVIDLTAHDETEQMDLAALRGAV
ncbi:hypothetical protein [Streptomyces sp. NPDC058045]|uniref:hypothetical protein n=1 Tax=Streptomyces sp. NPDC058045 TaxID=3346311 RepID=UPI0036E8371A